MPDSRIKEFTTYFHEEFKKKTGIPYFWKGGKEQKLMERAIVYFESVNPQDPMIKMKEAVQNFLQSQDKFIEEAKWDLSLFLSKPDRFIETKKEKRDRPIPDLIKQEEPEPLKFYSFEEFKEKFSEAAIKNPLPFARMFIRNKSFHKQVLGKEKYQFARMFLYDLLGKDRSLALAKEEESQIGETIKKILK